MKKIVFSAIAAISITASAAVSGVDEVISTTNSTKLANLVNKQAVAYDAALARTEDAKWPLSEQIAFTRAVSSVIKLPETQPAGLLSKVDFAGISDPVYMFNACSLLNRDLFRETEAGQAFMRTLNETRPAWAVICQGKIGVVTLTNAIAASKTDKCFGYNILVLTRHASINKIDISGVYRSDAWDNIPAAYLITAGQYYRLPSPNIGEPAAAVISDWFDACARKNAFKWVKADEKKQEQILLNLKNVDKIRKNKIMTANAYVLFKNLGYGEHFLFGMIDYLGDKDKIIDAGIETEGDLTPADIERFIVVVNALDISYRAGDQLKALKTINQRYTLKLYEDREKWEPILSKIRALIDTRS